MWARIQREALGGGPVVCGPEGGAGWGDSRPTRPRSPTSTTADAIVVAGDTEPVHRVPVIELRIRRALARGARVVTVGAGGTRLETRAAPGTSRPRPAPPTPSCCARCGGRRAGRAVSGRTVMIWNGRMSEPVAAVLAHVAHSHDAACC